MLLVGAPEDAEVGLGRERRLGGVLDVDVGAAGINGKVVTQFVPSACPLNRTEPCTLPDSDPAPAGPWLRVPMDNDPRHNQPIPRQSTEFTRLLAQRTSTERHFAHQHQLLPDRTYRRKHLWQIGTALHTLMRMGAAIVAKHKARFDALWNELFPKQHAA